MGPLDAIRPTALPALLFLVAWPLFWLVPPRWGRHFFIFSGPVFVLLVDGPLIAAGLVAAIVAGYGLVETVMRVERGRHVAFAVLLSGLHVAFWACFWLPLPEAYRQVVPRPADQPAVFILFSGIGLTFLRLVAYAWDRYRDAAERVSLGDYLAHMLFFPQLRHGPIERCTAQAEQLARARERWRPADLGWGLLRIVLTYVAVAAVVLVALGVGWLLGVPPSGAGSGDLIRHPERLGWGGLMLVMHVPLLLLYAAEAAFASIQLAVARCFGVVGSENFNAPLLARSPRDFWRRWNITLSSWLRDYAYIPLGGNRRHAGLNVVLVFVYCGLLHALQWRCLAWGLYTGVTLALYAWVTQRFLPDRHAWLAARPPWQRQAILLLARLATAHWLAIGVTIILDPETCGLRVLARYLELLTGGAVRLCVAG